MFQELYGGWANSEALQLMLCVLCVLCKYILPPHALVSPAGSAEDRRRCSSPPSTSTRTRTRTTRPDRGAVARACSRGPEKRPEDSRAPSRGDRTIL